MAYEQKLNTGALFRNEKKQGKQPDLTGTINANGVNYELAAWERTSGTGKKFFRLTVKANAQNE